MVTWKIEIADFKASFGPEWLTFCYQNQLKFKSDSATNFLGGPEFAKSIVISMVTVEK